MGSCHSRILDSLSGIHFSGAKETYRFAENAKGFFPQLR